MISFKLFVNAIQEAIIGANDALMDKNISILDKYFIEAPKDDKDDPLSAPKHTLIPKSVILEYPHLGNDGKVENLEVSVPLITLVPLSMSQLDKATLIANFRMGMENGEVLIDFAGENKSGIFKSKQKTSWGKIVMSFSPQQTSEGLKSLVDGYEAILKRQIS